MDKISLIKASLFRGRPQITLRGHVDECANSIIRGWAWDTARPDEAIVVEARTQSGKTLVAVANEYRPDLESSGFGNGRHGFRINASEWGASDGSISMYFGGTAHQFNKVAFTISGFTSSPQREVESDPGQELAWSIDDVNHARIEGWVVSRSNPSEEIVVFVRAKSGKEISAISNIPRGDLVGELFEDIKHSFSIDVSGFGPADWPVDLLARPGDIKLNRFPLRHAITERLLSHDPGQVVRSQFRSAAIATKAMDYKDERPQADDRHGVARAKTSVLFETADPQFDKEGLISKFLRYESFRIDRDKYEQAMRGNLQERMDILMWYIIKYLRDRQYKYVLPLSSKQIEFLNSPMPIQGYMPAVTVALYNFIKIERPDLLQLDNPTVLRQAVYWWCCERTPRDKTDSHLVTADQIALLSPEEQWLGEPFAINGFMSEYFSRNVKLHSLNMHNRLDRAVYFYYLILKSKSEPFILRFLPKDTFRNVLRKAGGSEIKFDDVIAHLSGLTVQDTKGLGESVEKAVLFSSPARPRSPDQDAIRDSGECYVERTEFPEGIEAGVALIGPLHKTSGLGQATRLSYATLENCEAVRPTGLAFELDNPAPVGFATTFDLQPYAARREINLIHLNAESVPLLYAFGQSDIVENSYNIGYFFWELNMIPKCHYLALELLDEIWVSSEYNREIYSRYTTKPVINVGMAVEELPHIQRSPKSAFGFNDTDTVFLTTFDSFSFIERKNPMGVLEAFRTAFPLGSEPVQLILKTQNRGRVYDPYQIDLWRRIDRIVSSDPRITVINETYHYKDLLALKQACDCYVSLHRAEGWGFGMIEAMQLGRPVIATAYSGNMDFCTAETTYLVDYEMIGVREAEYIFVERGSQWAQPNIAHAAERMREVASDRAAAEAKGAAAATSIKANFSVPAIAARYAARLAAIRSQEHAF